MADFQLSLSQSDIADLNNNIINGSVLALFSANGIVPDGTGSRVEIHDPERQWAIYYNRGANSNVLYIRKNENHYDASDKNAKEYCRSPYERCRLIPSVHTMVSLLLFVFSIVVVIVAWFSKSDQIVRNMSDLPSAFETIVKQAGPIFIVAYGAFLVHFVRIYFSFLVMEKDTRYFWNTLFPISKNDRKRLTEWILRTLVLVVLVGSTGYLLRFVGENSVGTNLDFWDRVSNSFAAPILLIYIVLFMWDLTMYRFVPINFKDKGDDRRKWFFTDMLGLIYAALLLAAETNMLGDTLGANERTIVIYVAVISGIAALAYYMLLGDLFVTSGSRYLQFLRYELLPIRSVSCGDNCPPRILES